jgi:death-on-curing protein
VPTTPPHDVRYLDLADFLVLAGAALDVAPEVALHAPAAAYGGVEFYPELVAKARVLLMHLVKDHPLPDGNKRAAYLAMIEFLASDVDAAIDMMVKIAGSEVDPAKVEDWISRQLD